MFPHLTMAPLNIITSAVTPAVMISAAAILAGGVSSKHSSLSDRLRSLTAEYRNPQTTPARCENIQQQCALFHRRLRLIAVAHMLIYGAAAFFVLMVFSISLAPVMAAWQNGLFPFFVAGVALMLIGVLFELLELRLADRTITLELYDTLHGRQ